VTLRLSGHTPQGYVAPGVLSRGAFAAAEATSSPPGDKSTPTPEGYDSEGGADRVLSASTGTLHLGGVITGNYLTFATNAGALERTLDPDGNAMDFLHAQLNEMTRNGVLLCGRYRLGDRSERRTGGTGGG